MSTAAPTGNATGRITVPGSTTEVADLVRAAHDLRAPVRVLGAGTWSGAGRELTCDTELRLTGLSGIVEYEPGDLTLTARAGTPLSLIDAATSVNGQFLALDPFGTPHGTLGATVATASYGALGHAFGGPRDATLGLEFVTGDGKVVRGGGRVVKNVAGFDLVRLLVGSWGTLGVITEVSVRLRALPEADETVALPLPADAGALTAMLASLRSAAIAPWAAEMICAGTARDLGLPPHAVVLLRLAGNPESVASQRGVVQSLGAAAPVPSSIWEAFRNFEHIQTPALVDGDELLVARFSKRPSQLVTTWMHALAVGSTGDARSHATLSRGVARVSMRGPTSSLRGAMRLPFEGRTIFERLPCDLWDEFAPVRMQDSLARGLRAQFDPHGILNPGLLGAI